MGKPNKICRVAVVEIDGANVVVREDGQPWPASRYIYADPSGNPNDPWLWDGPNPSAPDPLLLPPPADA